AASYDHLPPKSAYTPDWSLRMPIFTLPSEISAADAGMASAAARVAVAMADSLMQVSLRAEPRRRWFHRPGREGNRSGNRTGAQRRPRRPTSHGAAGVQTGTGG